MDVQKNEDIDKYSQYLHTENLLENFNMIVKNSFVPDFKTKIIEFSEYIVGPNRLQLMHASKSDCEEMVYLMLNLKKQLKNIISELGKSTEKEYCFNCSACNEQLDTCNSNFWESLQDHEHFEQLYCKALNEGFLTETEDVISSANGVERLSSVDSQNTNSTVEENECADELHSNSNIDLDILYDLDEYCNDFKFSFVPSYDDIVQKKLYPLKLVNTLRKYDKTEYPTILIVSPYKAVCLMCPCDLVSRSKINIGKHFFLQHISGNKHMKQASDEENVKAVIHFHETWLNKDPIIQAHQIHFKPEKNDKLWCDLCGIFIDTIKVGAHILSDKHKYRVIDIYQKSDGFYYLLDFQVQLYGIFPKPQEIKIEGTPKRIGAKKKENDVKSVAKSNKTGTPKQPESNQEVDVHNIINSVENPTSKMISECIPNRFKNHAICFSMSENIISCKVCETQFSVNIRKLASHICNERHLQLSKIPLTAYNYYCEVCNLRIPNEEAWLQHFDDAPKLHDKLPESRKKKTIEHECTTCCTIIYGDELSLSRHRATRRQRKPKQPKLAPAVVKMFESKESILTYAAKFVSEANQTLEHNGPTTKCCESVERHLSAVFENCKAHPFGSRITGLGNQKSDLDLFLDIGDMYNGNVYQDSMSQVQIVKKVYVTLLKARDEFQDVFQVPTARTPIVKFHHKPTQIECDVSFRHGLSVENTKFIRFCLDIQPICHPFILILKNWLHHNSLSEFVTTYALAMLAIFYLQTKGHLLSVKKIRELNGGDNLVINGWETIAYTVPLEEMKKHVVPFTESLVDLLKDFFLYYLNFPYSIDVICPLLGYCIKKKDFNGTGRNLPPEMRSYCNQLQSNDREEFRNASPLCIQDPFDLSHNLTKALQPGTLNNFKSLCELSYKLIHSL